jgi:hypothetical protein
MKTKATLLTISSLFILVLAAYTQAPSKQWDVRFGGDEEDVFYDLLQTNDGGFIFAGTAESGMGGDVSQPSNGDDDYWIVKTDAGGIKQWDLRYGGAEEDYLIVIRKTTDGGYIMGGKSFSNIGGDKTQPNQGGKDFWIVKIDAAGTKQWDATFGGLDNEALFDLQQTTDGGYIMGGPSETGISGDKTQPSQGKRDFWVVKTDANGVKEWDHSYGGNDDDYLKSLRQTSDGGYILGGSSQSDITGDKTAPNMGKGDYWIVKIDAAGTKQWDLTYGGSGDEDLKSVFETTDGGYIMGGSSLSGASGNKSQDSQGDEDYWIVKTDVNGVIHWDARFGGSDNDFLKSMQQTSDGGYILGGYSASGMSGDKSQPSQGESDYWLVKTNGNGAKVWDVSFGGDGDDDLKTVQQTTDGYILGGKCTSGQSGDKTQPSQGENDYWIVKTDAGGVATSVFSGVVPTSATFTITPNPASVSATISFALNESGPVSMDIMDVSGRNVQTMLNTTLSKGIHELTFNRSNLAAGTYFVQLKTNNEVMVRNLVLE